MMCYDNVAVKRQQHHGDDFLIHFIQEAKKLSKSGLKYILIFLKWVGIAVATGISGGLVGTAFHKSVELVTEVRTAWPFIIYLLPISGLAIAWIYRFFKLESVDTNRIISSVRSDKKVPIALAPAIFVSTVLTHLFGGSAGREGAALQLGGTIGYHLGRLFRLTEKDSHLIVMCGMSAVFSALFGTPLTAALFAMGVISIGIMYYSGLVPCVVSALTAYSVAGLFKVEPVRYHIIPPVGTDIKTILLSALIGVICAGVSVLFCLLMHKSEKYIKKYIKDPFVRAFVGGLVIILLSFLPHGREYLGAGTGIIDSAVNNGIARPEAFLLKMIFTAVTIGCGYKGGEIVPTFFIGSTLGCTVSGLLGIDSGFGASLGLVATFCGVVNCPIASIMLAVELFSTGNIIPYAVACAVSFMLSGNFGLYRDQKIMYSKLTAEYVNANAH